MTDDQRIVVVGAVPMNDGGALLLSVFNSLDKETVHQVRLNVGMAGYGQNCELRQIDSDRIVAAWEQCDNTGSRVVCALFKLSQPDSLRQVEVSDAPGTHSQAPRIACWHGGFVIAWTDFRSKDGAALFFRQFTTDGTPLGPNREISHGISNPMYPAVSCNAVGLMGFAWQEGISDEFRIAAVISPWSGAPGTKTRIDQAGGAAYNSNPDILVQDSVAMVTWKDYRTGEANVYLQKISFNGTLMDANRLVNDDTVQQWQRLPRIAGNSGKEFIIVWEDYRADVRNQIGDIYAQAFMREGTPLGPNMRINNSPEPSPQEFPALSMNSRGEAVIAWVDGRERRMAVYYRRLLAQHRELEGEVKVY